MAEDRTNAERQRRYIARLKAAAGKAGVSNADIAAWATQRVEMEKRLEQAGAHFRKATAALDRLAAELEKATTENAALKDELARERKQRAAAETKHSKPDVADDDHAAAAGPVGRKVFKILLKLDDANDNTVLVAARTLVSNLKASGSDLRVLADAMGAAWEKQEKAKPAPPPNIDWSQVEAAVTRYAADRATVNFNKLLKALYAEIASLKANRGWSGNQEAARYIVARLRHLGFKGSSSGLTWERSGPGYSPPPPAGEPRRGARRSPRMRFAEGG